MESICRGRLAKYCLLTQNNKLFSEFLLCELKTWKKVELTFAFLRLGRFYGCSSHSVSGFCWLRAISRWLLGHGFVTPHLKFYGRQNDSCRTNGNSSIVNYRQALCRHSRRSRGNETHRCNMQSQSLPPENLRPDPEENPKFFFCQIMTTILLNIVFDKE